MNTAIHTLSPSLSLSFTACLLLIASSAAYAQTCDPCRIVEDWNFSTDNDELDDEFWDVELVDYGAGDAIAVVGGTQFSGGAGRQGVLYLLNTTNGSVITGFPKYFGSSGQDILHSVEQASNGNLIMCGTKESSNVGSTNSDNVWLVEYDINNQNTITQKEYGGTGNEWGWDIKEAPTGLYVMVARSGKESDVDLTGQSTNAKGEYWVLDIDPDNNYQINWSRTFNGGNLGGTGMGIYDMATGLAIDDNGHYLVTGHCKSCETDKTHDEVMIVTVTPNANPANYTWTTNDVFGYASRDQISWDIIKTADDGYLASGVTHPNIDDPGCYDNEHNVYEIRTDDQLADTWTPGCQVNQGIGYGGTYADNAYSAVELDDGGFLVVGETKSDDYDVTCNHNDPDTYYDAWLMKINSDGEWQWDESFGSDFDDYWRSIKRLDDGTFIMAGSKGTGLLDELQNYYVIKFHLAPCDPPENLDRVVNGCEATLTWEMDPCVPAYKLKIRKNTSGTWDHVINPATSPYLFEGDPGATYKWRLESLCSPDEISDFINGTEFTLSSCNKIGISNPPEIDSRVAIYPNPSNGSFEIAIPDLKEQDQSVTIEILNHLGKVEAASTVPLFAGLIKYSIPRFELSAGIYVARVFTDSKVYQTKLAVSRF